MQPATTARESSAARIFVLLTMIALALNLRAAVGSLGVVLAAVRSDLAMSATIGGVLTTLPVICFAVFGSTTGPVVRSVGLHRTVVLALGLIVVGLGVRATTSSQSLFIAASAVALAGGAIGNVALPPLVKRHFPDKIATVSAMYTAAILGGATLSAAVTVPLADAGGSWRTGLGAWGVLAAVTLLPWLALVRHDQRVDLAERAPLTLAQVAHSRLAWVMALFFAVQSAQAYAQFGWLPEIYTDAGLSAGKAALMQTLVSGIGIPVTLALPLVMGVVGRRPVLPWVFGAVTVAGWSGVLLAPLTAPWLWALLLGLGGTAFSWVLTMLGQRSRTTGGTAALSSFVQGLGYLIAAVGPFGAGLLHDLTGDWSVAIIALASLGLLLVPLGLYVNAGHIFEDTLPEGVRPTT